MDYKSNSMQYKYNNEIVEMERWVWGVVYHDDTELHQFSDDGVFHRIGEINQEKVKMFTMYKPDNMLKRIDIFLPQGAKIIHKYRHVKLWYKDTFVKVYVFGYKLGDKYAFHYILPDDRIIISVEDNVSLDTVNIQ